MAMNLPDENVLVHAVNTAVPQHSVAKHCLASASNATTRVALTWAALLGVVRLGTRRGILANLLPVDDALTTRRMWLTHPMAPIPHPGNRHLDLVSRLLVAAGTAGNLTTDAHHAAIAIEHGATLVSFDRSFERFAGLSFKLLK
jgi:uncharacterized protein